MDSIDTLIIGAGALGLEAEALIGSHTSSRNSEVIHAGLSR